MRRTVFWIKEKKKDIAFLKECWEIHWHEHSKVKYMRYRQLHRAMAILGVNYEEQEE